MKEKIENAKQIIKRQGVPTFIRYMSRRFLQSLYTEGYRRFFLFELSIPRPAPESVRAAEGHVFRFATMEDILEYQKDPVWDIAQIDVTAFEKGDRCLLQLDGDKLVGYAWLASSSLVEIGWGFHFNMPDDTVYNYKGFTAPEYRGKGFQPLRHLKLLEHVKKSGQRRLFGYVDHLNLKSLRGVQKSGYQKIGVLRCLKKRGRIRFKLDISADNWSTDRRT